MQSHSSSLNVPLLDEPHTRSEILHTRADRMIMIGEYVVHYDELGPQTVWWRQDVQVYGNPDLARVRKFAVIYTFFVTIAAIFAVAGASKSKHHALSIAALTLFLTAAASGAIAIIADFRIAAAERVIVNGLKAQLGVEHVTAENQHGWFSTRSFID